MGDRHKRAPLAAPPSLNFPAGPEPPAPPTAGCPGPPSQARSRPLGSGSAGQQEKPRAVATRQLTSKCGGRVARRGKARRISGSADARGDRMQVRVPAAGGPEAPPRRRPPLPPSGSRLGSGASGRGRGSLTRCQAPRTTWLPGRRAARAAH